MSGLGRHTLLPLAVVGLAVALRFVPGLPERLQLLSFDAYQRLSPRDYAEAPVRIVEIDDRSLAAYGQWPWPRTTLAELVERLGQAGAAAIAFDMVFAEPDRLSPSALATALRGPTAQDMAPLLRALPDSDSVFAAAIGAAPVVLGHVLVEQADGSAPQIKAGFSWAGAQVDPTVAVKRFPGAVVNLAPLEAAATGNGFFNHAPEWDRVVRRVPLVLALTEGERKVLSPSLAAESLRVAQGARSYLGRGAAASGETYLGQNTGMSAIRIGRIAVPTDAAGRLWLHYTESPPGSAAHAARYVSAKEVLDGHVDPARIEGMIVFVAATFAASQDFVATPLDASLPGVEVHAQIAEQILQQNFLMRPDWAFGAETMFTAAAGIGLVFLIPALGAVLGALAAAGGIALALAGSWYAFAAQHLLIDPAYAAVSILLVYGIGSLLGYMRTEARQREIRHAFTHYMAPALVDELAAHPEKLVLGGEIRTMSLMFCDVRGFTTISEGLTAEQLTRFMNSFLSPMTEIIMANKGYIDKYIGDCIMAFWNAPLDDPEHAANAVRAAQAMRRRLAELNADWRSAAEAAGRTYQPLRIGIGVNSGECCVGNMGSDLRMNYSVLGDTVNLASRLESLGKTYGVDLVVGEATAALLGDTPLVELDLVAVKGKAQAVRIFTVLPDATPPAPEHDQMIAAYRHRDWDGALAILGAGDAELMPMLRGCYELYRHRIEEFMSAPPPEDWDGVYVAKEK